jgi:ribosome-associated toxin RatA of RatAB toxin-antitoxin module
MMRRASQLGRSACRHSSLSLSHDYPSLLSGSSAAGGPHGCAVTTPSRLFFPPGTPGKSLLQHLTSPSEPTQAVSPFASFRPPAPPSAADAQPFGSLNRTNHLRRYVNVNTVAAGSGAGDGGDNRSSLQTNNTKNNDSCSSSSTPLNADLRGGVAAENSCAATSPPQMDLSKLVRRYTSCPTTTPGAAASSSPSATGATSCVVPSVINPGAATPSSSSVTSSPATSTSTSTHATVARARAAIAAAQHSAATQQQRPRQRGSDSTSTTEAHARRTRGENKADKGMQARQHVQVYKEHCTIGWSPDEFYRVVADVEHYTDFLPWCAGSTVHTTRRVRVPRGRRLLPGNLPQDPVATSSAFATPSSPHDPASNTVHASARAAAEAELVDAIEMTATLTIGFSFLKEQYTSRVTLYPGTKIVAALYDDESNNNAAEAAATRTSPASSQPMQAHHDSFVVSLFKKAASTAGAAAKRSILKHLLCEWEFCAVPNKPNTVEVVFSVSFEFKNPLHSHMIMSNVVTLMTRSFERRCEGLYGPPSVSKESLPLFH